MGQIENYYRPAFPSKNI